MEGVLLLLLLLLLMSAKPQQGVLMALEQQERPMRMDVTFIPVHSVVREPPTTIPLQGVTRVLI